MRKPNGYDELTQRQELSPLTEKGLSKQNSACRWGYSEIAFMMWQNFLTRKGVRVCFFYVCLLLLMMFYSMEVTFHQLLCCDFHTSSRKLLRDVARATSPEVEMDIYLHCE